MPIITWYECSILATTCITSVTCTLPGIFLVLRSTAMLSDAISHAMLPGIVIAFLCSATIHSPLLFVGGCIAGIIAAIIAEWAAKTHALSHDAALGLTFPALFSMGILLICLCTRHVHLDADMVLLGEVGLAPLDCINCYGYWLGPRAFWIMLILCIGTSGTLWMLSRDLIAHTFDPFFARATKLHNSFSSYILLLLVSMSTVAAFDIVGSLVVVALTVIPPATARLIARSLQEMIVWSMVLSIQSSICGYAMARYYDVSISGAIASTHGLFFLLALFLITYNSRIERTSRAFNDAYLCK